MYMKKIDLLRETTKKKRIEANRYVYLYGDLKLFKFKIVHFLNEQELNFHVNYLKAKQ